MLSDQLVFNRIGLKDDTRKAMRKLCFSERQNKFVELELYFLIAIRNKYKQ
jgi:hypothetical protein